MTNLERRRRILAASTEFTLALNKDGTVWAWGDNSSGQLATGAAGDLFPTPLQISDIDSVVSIDAGFDSALVLRLDGSVWGWGFGGEGCLGEHSTSYLLRPTPLASLRNVDDVVCGSNFCLARQKGRVLAWGNNFYGALGNGSFGNEFSSPIPSIIPQLRNIVDIAAGDGHCLAVSENGSVWAWGGNTRNQLADGERFVFKDDEPVDAQGAERYLKLAEQWYVPTPQQISGMENIIRVAAGQVHSLALTNDGHVWAWGANEDGQAGIEERQVVTRPMRVSGLDNIVAISAGENHSLALTEDGYVLAWGGNRLGQLGNGLAEKYQVLPQRVELLDKIVAIDAGYEYSVAVQQDGSVWSWGCNSQGQLGDGTTQDRRLPTPIDFTLW